MGTRSITILKEADTEIAVLYRQFDGHPESMGSDIIEALGGKTVVNGYSSNDQINGAGDMAIQLIAWLKKAMTMDRGYAPTAINSPGGLYLYPAGTRDCGEEFTYILTCPRLDIDLDRSGPTPEIMVKVDHWEPMFEGTMTEFKSWIEARS
jgi:hypothetical protein